MLEALAEIVFHLVTQADADGVSGAYVPKDFMLTGISVFANATGITGTPTTATIDIQDDGTDIVTAQDVSSNGYTELTTPLYIAAESVIEIDLNFSGGSSPAFSGDIGLIGYWGE